MTPKSQVNALSVLDWWIDMYATPAGESQSNKELRQARAAVAELIEAARELLAVSEMAAMLNVFPGNPNANGPLPRTRAALSRIGGAK